MIIGVVLSISIGILLLLKNISLYVKNKELQSNNEQLIRINALYQSAYKSAKSINNMGQNISVDKDIRDAIKLARDKSHPDNGGSSDEFIRFQQLYERICK